MNVLEKTMANAKKISLAVIIFFGLINCHKALSISFFLNGDNGAGPEDARPNSNAAAASFDGAAGILGPVSIINFEDQPVGNFSSLMAARGVTITLGNTSSEASGGIAATDDVKLGYNVTGNGSKHLRVVPIIEAGKVTVNFTFDIPVQAFGTYLTGVGTANGDLHLLFNDGTNQDFSITGYANGGVQFAGFISKDAYITSVTMELQNITSDSRDIFGIDDVRYVYTPEPATLLLLGLGARLCLRVRRGRRQF